MLEIFWFKRINHATTPSRTGSLYLPFIHKGFHFRRKEVSEHSMNEGVYHTGFQ